MAASPVSRNDFSFFHGLRVRWSEVDPQGIVFNGNYLTYADVATTEYYRHLGVSYPADLLRGGGDLFAVKTTLEYLAPARFDDWLEMGVRASRLGRSSLTFQVSIWCDEQLLTLGELIYAYAGEDRTSQPLPDWLRGKINEFERVSPQQ
ncbi:acyl-CoA thioesterase [Pseudomonas sp. HS-18]|uniref:acyl-CoA thioesterase n=1 Tax=Pseudomonas sp. HS-18 TaxID=2879114 RepID=UPI001CF0169C|nr:thioesterase family protein [Pseudomonas sp. HS-18]UCL86898.1 acyl-CoA thioesterase [Pseudomonas sp. HS-18]